MNIQKALLALRDFGMSDEQIGDNIGASQSIVSRLRRGVHKTTSYVRGAAIMSLVKEKLPNYKD
jgi:IS30 family transposase